MGFLIRPCESAEIFDDPRGPSLIAEYAIECSRTTSSRGGWRMGRGSSARPKYGLSVPEIAAALGCPRKTVESLYARAMAKLTQEDAATVMEQLTVEARPLIGCGSVECRQDWIERNGDYFEM